jgi:hypothetical protein
MRYAVLLTSRSTGSTPSNLNSHIKRSRSISLDVDSDKSTSKALEPSAKFHLLFLAFGLGAMSMSAAYTRTGTPITNRHSGRTLALPVPDAE